MEKVLRPRQNKGQELVDRKLVEAAPGNFVAGRPKAALLFWFFGDFRCGVVFFIVILVIYTWQKKLGILVCTVK